MKAALVLAACCALLAAPAIAQDDADAPIDSTGMPSEPVEDVPAGIAAPPAPPPVLPAAPEAKAAPASEMDIAVLQGLKKVSAESSTFEAPVDVPTQFGSLTITVKKCMKSSPDVQPENSALILIQDTRPGEAPATVFSGWMFSSSPAISALEHPVYDITMIDCTTHKKPPAPEPAAEEKPKSKKKK